MMLGRSVDLLEYNKSFLALLQNLKPLSAAALFAAIHLRVAAEQPKNENAENGRTVKTGQKLCANHRGHLQVQYYFTPFLPYIALSSVFVYVMLLLGFLLRCPSFTSLITCHLFPGLLQAIGEIVNAERIPKRTGAQIVFSELKKIFGHDRV